MNDFQKLKSDYVSMKINDDFKNKNSSTLD